jgi:hypothetical protein
MSSLAWMAGQLGSITPARRRPGPSKAVDVAEVVDFGRSRGIHLTSANVALQFGIAVITAHKRLTEAEARGLVRRHRTKRPGGLDRYEPV